MSERAKPSLSRRTRARTQAVQVSREFQTLDLGPRNWRILAAGVASVVAGFLILAWTRDTVFAPILLVGGYLGLIPWGLVARPGSQGSEDSPVSE